MFAALLALSYIILYIAFYLAVYLAALQIHTELKINEAFKMLCLSFCCDHSQ